MNADYSHLYRIFGLQPGCSLDAFRQAYRRHVASQHPDKAVPGLARHDDASLPLPELIALYDQAMRFHRRYGRLPGATPMAHPSAQDAAPAPPTEPDDSHLVQTAGDRDRPAPAGASRWLLLLAIVAALLLAIDTWHTPSELAPPRQADFAAPQALSEAKPLAHALALGMDRSTVLAIQGEPVQQGEDEWDYGPSWVRFEKGRLSDWYSSPYYRLKTATSIPPDDDPEH